MTAALRWRHIWKLKPIPAPTQSVVLYPRDRDLSRALLRCHSVFMKIKPDRYRRGSADPFVVTQGAYELFTFACGTSGG